MVSKYKYIDIYEGRQTYCLRYLGYRRITTHLVRLK